MIGSFPALNTPPIGQIDIWLNRIMSALAETPGAAPFAVNQIIHRSNERLDHDLDACVRH